MARNFAQIQSRVWTDDHFKTHLSVDAQWLYFALLSQPNINAAGVLPLQDRRWSRLARDLTADRIDHALTELQAHWYVLVDEDTEEVLIRTFIRNDELWKQPNVLKGALNYANNTMSETLKAVIWHEVDQLPLDRLEPEREKKTRTLIGTLRPTLRRTLPEGFMEPPQDPSQAPSEGHDHGYRAPVVPITPTVEEIPQVIDGQLTLPAALKEGFTEGFPEGFPEPSGEGAGAGEGAGESLSEVKEISSAPSPSGEADPEPSSTPPGYDDPRFQRFWSRYPDKVSKKKACAAFFKALKRTTFDNLMFGLERYLTQDRRALDGYVKDPTTWLNGDCWDDEPLRPAANGGPTPNRPNRSIRDEWMARQ